MFAVLMRENIIFFSIFLYLLTLTRGSSSAFYKKYFLDDNILENLIYNEVKANGILECGSICKIKSDECSLFVSDKLHKKCLLGSLERNISDSLNLNDNNIEVLINEGKYYTRHLKTEILY